MLSSLSRGPRCLAGRLARFYTWLLDKAIPGLRRAALRNLEMAMPELSPLQRRGIVAGVFASLARMLVSFARFPALHRGNIGDWIRYQGWEHFEEARRGGKGVLFATAHLGNWELSAFAHALLTEPMQVVIRPLDNPLLDALVNRYRSLTGNRIIGKKDYARSILKALGANQAVGILIDQNTLLDEGVFVDFFGIPACTGSSFARLAAHTGAAVILGFALWSEEEGRYVLDFSPPVALTGDTLRDTQLLQAKLEEAIRRHPDQWLWLHRRWKTRPPGEAGLY